MYTHTPVNLYWLYIIKYTDKKNWFSLSLSLSRLTPIIKRCSMQISKFNQFRSCHDPRAFLISKILFFHYKKLVRKLLTKHTVRETRKTDGNEDKNAICLPSVESLVLIFLHLSSSFLLNTDDKKSLPRMCVIKLVARKTFLSALLRTRMNEQYV